MNWDDSETIVRNFPIHSFSPDSLKWIFTNTGQGYWVPMTWLSLDLDYHLGGLNPQIYHWDSLLLHLVNVSLAFLLAYPIFNFSLRPEDRAGASWIMPGAFLAAFD